MDENGVENDVDDCTGGLADHGQHGSAVECAGEYDDIGSFSDVSGDFDCVFISFRTAVDEHGLFLVASHRYNFVHLLSHLDIWFMGSHVHHRVEVLL